MHVLIRRAAKYEHLEEPCDWPKSHRPLQMQCAVTLLWTPKNVAPAFKLLSLAKRVFHL